MGEGIGLLPKRALLHLIALNLRPEDSGAKHSSVDVWSPVLLKRVIALLLSSVRFGVERPITFAAILDPFVSLVRFLTKHIVKIRRTIQ